MMLEDMLVELGCIVVGPAATLAAGLSLAADADFDLAVLDVNVQGERSDRIAQLLDTKGKAYTFATGYGAADLPDCASRKVIHKPYTFDQLAGMLHQLTGDDRPL